MKLKKFDLTGIDKPRHPHIRLHDLMEGRVPLIYEMGDWEDQSGNWTPGCGFIYIEDDSGENLYIVENLFSFLYEVDLRLGEIMFKTTSEDLVSFEKEVLIGKDKFRNFKIWSTEI